MLLDKKGECSACSPNCFTVSSLVFPGLSFLNVVIWTACECVLILIHEVVTDVLNFTNFIGYSGKSNSNSLSGSVFFFSDEIALSTDVVNLVPKLWTLSKNSCMLSDT